MEEMKDIEKALRDIAEAIKQNEAVTKVSIRIDMKPAKPSKAPEESK